MKESPYRLAEIDLSMFERDILAKPRTVMPQMLFNGRKGKDGVEMPKEGGVLSWFEGSKYPYKGIMIAEPLKRMSILKKVLLESVILLTSKPIKYFLPFLVLLPKSWLRQIMISAMKSFANLSYGAIGDTYLKPFRFCKSGREIYKVSKEVMIERFPELGLVAITRIVKGFCMMWDFDPSYRYMGQDIFGELNQEALKKNPAKELSRLFDIMIKREVSEDKERHLKSNLKKFKIILIILAKKGLLKEFVEILGKLDIEKFKLDEGDTYNFSVFPHYNLKGILYEDRLQMREGMEHN